MAEIEVLSKVTIVTRREKKEELRAALQKLGVTGMTVTNCTGCGVQKAVMRYYRGAKKEIKLLPQVKFEITLCEIPVDDVIKTAKEVLYTGEIGDGKIFVEEEKRVVKIRTGEEGVAAL